MKTANEIAWDFFGDARGGDEHIIEVMELYGKEVKANVEFDDEKISKVITEIWNAGFETNINRPDSYWIQKIKECIK